MPRPSLSATFKSMLLYGAALALALGAFLLELLKYRQAMHALPPKLYILLIAIAFTLFNPRSGTTPRLRLND